MEKWSAIDKDGTHLATIRVYDKEDPAKKQRIVLLVPPEPGIDVNNGDFDEYELDMVNESVDNQFVIADREKAPGSRARTSILTGRVKHECNMRPLFTDAYRRRMRERTKLANTPQRQIRLIDEVASTGRINMLSSGVAPGSAGFSTLVVRPAFSQSPFLHLSIHCRKQNKSRQRAHSSVLLVCLEINF